jgi:hypothetical protein
MTDFEFDDPRTGTFPKLEELEGDLLLITPSLVETVVNQFDRDGTKPTRERAVADVTVFRSEGQVEEIRDMYLSQAALLSTCKAALRPGAKPMVLGRLVKVATKDTATRLKIGNTPEEFATARAAWVTKGAKGAEPKHVWVLQAGDEEDKVKARAYLTQRAQTQAPTPAPAPDPETAPF